MNYIKQLQTERDDLKARIENAMIDIDAFQAFLQSAKFVGTESDGGRKDWISTGDVAHQLANMRSSLR